jgi:hypothetical protein
MQLRLPRVWNGAAAAGSDAADAVAVADGVAAVEGRANPAREQARLRMVSVQAKMTRLARKVRRRMNMR